MLYYSHEKPVPHCGFDGRLGFACRPSLWLALLDRRCGFACRHRPGPQTGDSRFRGGLRARANRPGRSPRPALAGSSPRVVRHGGGHSRSFPHDARDLRPWGVRRHASGPPRRIELRGHAQQGLQRSGGRLLFVALDRPPLRLHRPAGGPGRRHSRRSPGAFARRLSHHAGADLRRGAFHPLRLSAVVGRPHRPTWAETILPPPPGRGAS